MSQWIVCHWGPASGCRDHEGGEPTRERATFCSRDPSGPNACGIRSLRGRGQSTCHGDGLRSQGHPITFLFGLAVRRALQIW